MALKWVVSDSAPWTAPELTQAAEAKETAGQVLTGDTAQSGLFIGSSNRAGNMLSSQRPKNTAGHDFGLVAHSRDSRSSDTHSVPEKNHPTGNSC